MFRNALMTLSVVTAGCFCAPPAPPPPPQVMESPDAGVGASARGNLRFKGPERLVNDVAAALELRADQVCTELGQYQCASLVHNVALGGVDPYGPGLYEPSGITAVTTPLVVDRVALSACTRRVDADLATPQSAVVFRGVPLNGKKLANPDGSELPAVIGELTRRVLAREPYDREVSRYVQLARELDASPEAEPARAWMQAVCFAVVSSTESVFY
ncbi:MAG: hypothetical protein SFW67_17710 [Myxococcaceae bacterium]|nr:hypothetical protein [Myxococcaceae bacterium]